MVKYKSVLFLPVKVGMVNIFDYRKEMLCLRPCQFLDFPDKFPGIVKIIQFVIKKILGGNVEIIANIKKDGQGRKRFPIFNSVDIAGILT